MTTPTNVAPDDARHDYIARVYKMTHAELFNELMRVHTEANKLVEQAVKEEREACAKLIEADGLARGDEGLVFIKAAERIRAREQA